VSIIRGEKKYLYRGPNYEKLRIKCELGNFETRQNLGRGTICINVTKAPTPNSGDSSLLSPRDLRP